MQENHGAAHTDGILKFKIESKTYETSEQYLTGADLKKLAGIPLETDLYLSITKPFKDELIENEKSVNLARPETEYFFVKKKLIFFIDGKEYSWYKQFIRGIQIRELGKIGPDHDIYLDIKEGYQDDFITDDEIVDLARPGKERFFSKKRDLKITLKVNSRDKAWDKLEISYSEVITLAGYNPSDPRKAYTVTYAKGPRQNPQGEMAKGDVVFVIDKMIFNVSATDKS